MDAYAFKTVAGENVPHLLEQGNYFFGNHPLHAKPTWFRKVSKYMIRMSESGD